MVVDDAEQGVSHVVRGVDLLDSTPRQLFLQRALGLPTPAYLHFPVVANPAGVKLSKQSQAPALPEDDPVPQLLAAWACLGQAPFPDATPPSLSDFWQWARQAWDPGRIPAAARVPAPDGA